MKILLSWFDLSTDMETNPLSQTFGGPTLAAIRLHDFDYLYLFANTRDIYDKALALQKHVKAQPRDFRVRHVEPKFIAIGNPTDYRELWDTVPGKVEDILKGHRGDDPKLYINLSAGTPAMRTTWLMMLGCGQIEATALNVQRIDANQASTVEAVDIGIYPFVSYLKQTADRQVDIPNSFRSESMQLTMRQLALITGKLNMPILLTGETGTGKTTIAGLYHKMTGGSPANFHHFVCGEFDVADLNTIKSQLFGHVKGAFTGADKDHKGIFEVADGGTVFLDEIGDIPKAVQRLLINAVEKKTFRRMNGSDFFHSDFRLICATNYDIAEMLKTGRLAQDFYNRIRSCEYRIPPLRERKEDVPKIIQDLLATEKNYQQLQLTDEAMAQLTRKILQRHLPGNIRDIQQILDQLTIQAMQPGPHPITVEEVEDCLAALPEPLADDPFVERVHAAIDEWPTSSFAYKGAKWQETILEIALGKLLSDRQYRKKNGELNIAKIAGFLGVDHKTIKSRLKDLGR